jgi:hypothetical protein
MDKFYPNMTSNLYNNNSIPKSTDFFKNDNDDNRCMKFNLTKNEYYDYIYSNNNLALYNGLLFVITLDNSSIYDYFEINFESFAIKTKVTKAFSGRDVTNEVNLLSNQYVITPGLYHKYYLHYTSSKYYSSSLSGFLGFDADKDDIDIEISTDVLAQIPNAFTTVLELTFNKNHIVKDDITYKNDGN